MVEEKKIELQDYDTDDYSQVVEIIQEKSLEIRLVSDKPHDLLVYFGKRFKQEHGYDYTVDWIKDTTIMKAYVQRFGPDSGPMVELLFDKHRGIWNGTRVSVSIFSKGAKWIQDQLRSELQDLREEQDKPKTDTTGVMSSSDFLNRLSVDEGLR